ncbi:SRPBCC family protein [Dactylosporangium aurantiacum]|uniref:SRPBCC family protein n=1 Tax=Dactylosporangium aurantiacum TaxID=35754 RepID=A0A9Q9MAS4_9ACTN|nr:SRPBCC family protein [Dactylosporangium aurantiacum]MDG6108866.1 SRPBCC family protein [Dactylosporangium aurantiacum]UWZ52163.1 SRPBCC family protein [Dactylosporangium aurantiacum]
MTIEFSETVPVGAPAEVVGRIMCDVAQWPRWTASVSTVERSGTGPLRVGETVVVKQPKLPPSTWTVTKVGPTGFEWTSRSPGIRNVAGHWATDAGDGTCTAALTLSFAGPLARPTLLFYSGLVRRYMAMEGEGLRAEATRTG